MNTKQQFNINSEAINKEVESKQSTNQLAELGNPIAG